jgi:hypothetical protein
MIVSDCCKAPVLTGIKREYPLGGKTWHETFKVEYCESCGNECDKVEEVNEE